MELVMGGGIIFNPVPDHVSRRGNRVLVRGPVHAAGERLDLIESLIVIVVVCELEWLIDLLLFFLVFLRIHFHC